MTAIRWNAETVRALREHLGMSQAELGQHLGIRQQTVSDWEIDKHRIQRHLQRMLAMVAEQSGFHSAEWLE